ncbi:Carboxypeptidase G2 [Aquamicrobium terrae]
MEYANLHFNQEEILNGLRRWVECESPTFDVRAVNRCMDIACYDLAAAGARIERIAGQSGFADCVRARFPHSSDAPGILVLGHLDTVHPIGTLVKLPWRVDGRRSYGPGILDMKGGNYVALHALRQLAKAKIATQLPVTFLFTSDEEVGSPSTRTLIEEEAKRNAYVLVPEPAPASRGVISGRYAIARFNLEATGRPSHAGSNPEAGRSAIREMLRKIGAIEAMTTENCKLSVGVIRGGQWANCIPTTCTGEALSMAKQQADLDNCVHAMLALSGENNGVSFRVTRGVTRPVWKPGAKTLRLFDIARGIAREIGFDISHESAGGGSDGNFAGALGIPTLDGLGLAGSGYHTLEEHVELDSLIPRSQLIAGLLAHLT